MLEIELSRIDDEGEVWWSGECGLQGDSVGIDLDPEPDLAAVVEQVLEVGVAVVLAENRADIAE